MALSRSYVPLKLSSLLTAFAQWKMPSRRLPQEAALRAELFSADQMELHGVRLAGQHRLSTGSGLDHLLLNRLRFFWTRFWGKTCFWKRS